MSRLHLIAYSSSACLITGGFLLFVPWEIFISLPFIFLVCVIGVMLTLLLPYHQPHQKSTYLGVAGLVLTGLCALAGIVGHLFPITVATEIIATPDGDSSFRIINSSLTHFTDRYGTLSAFLTLGLSLLALACSAQQPHRSIVTIYLKLSLGGLNFLIYAWSVINIILDGDFLYWLLSPLLIIYGLCWAIWGVVILWEARRGVRSLSTPIVE